MHSARLLIMKIIMVLVVTICMYSGSVLNTSYVSADTASDVVEQGLPLLQKGATMALSQQTVTSAATQAKIAELTTLLQQLMTMYTQLLKKQSETIEIVTPNGNEKLEIGKPYVVTWKPYNTSMKVNLLENVNAYLLDRNGDRVGKLINQGTNSFTTDFTIDDYTTDEDYIHYAVPGWYFVEVMNHKEYKKDRSNKLFELLPLEVDIKMSDSDGAVKLYDNQPVSVSISARNGLSSFKSCTLTGVRSAVEGSPTIVVDASKTTINGYAYAPVSGGVSAISITCIKTDGTSVMDKIQVTPVKEAPSLKIISPNGGEMVSTDGTVRAIVWKQLGLSSVSLALYKNGQFVKWIVENLEQVPYIESHEYNWKPSSDEAVGSALGAVYKIYITGKRVDGMGYLSDTSDLSFRFISNIPAPTVTVTADKTTVNAGETATITWSSTDATSCSLVNTAQTGLQGSYTTAKIYMNTYYTVSCTSGSGKVTQQSITISVKK